MVSLLKIKENKKINLIIKILVILVYAGLLISIGTDAFSRSVELVLCAIATVGSFYLFIIKKK